MARANVSGWKTLAERYFLAGFDVFARRPGAQKKYLVCPSGSE